MYKTPNLGRLAYIKYFASVIRIICTIPLESLLNSQPFFSEVRRIDSFFHTEEGGSSERRRHRSAAVFSGGGLKNCKSMFLVKIYPLSVHKKQHSLRAIVLIEITMQQSETKVKGHSTDFEIIFLHSAFSFSFFPK